MIIKIIAGAWAKRYNIAGETAVEIKDGASIADILDDLPIPPNEIGMASLNGKAVVRETVLRDGDKLEIFPVIIDG